MSQPTARLAILLAALASGSAWAACEFDGGEITNPFDPSCGGTVLTYTESDDAGENIALGYPVPIPVDSLSGVDGYRSYASLHAQHQLLSADSDRVRARVVGPTIAGRDIWAYFLGDADDLTVDGLPEPAVMINGGIHAREWQSPEVVTELFEQLIEIADDGGLGAYLAENLNVVLIPVLNIDGFIQTQSYPRNVTADEGQPRDGRMRRKNMRNPNNSSAPVDGDLATVDDNFFGIDLNRNNAYGFGQNGRSSTSATSLVNRGTAPASEPEIVALQAAAGLAPADRLRLYVDVHSFTSVFVAALTGNLRRDSITSQLSFRMRAVTNFSYRASEAPPGTEIGLTSDYFAFEYQIPSWTLEIEPTSQGGAQYGGTGVSHSGFVLPDTEIARVRDELAATHLLGFYKQAGPPRIQAIEIREAASNTVVYAAEWGGGTSRNLAVTVNAALLAGADYHLWLAFDRPMRWRDENGSIANYPGQSVAAFPSLTLELPALDEELLIAGDASAWLDVPGGAPAGYRRYRDDALMVDFTLPASFEPTEASPLVIAVESTDLAQSALDADPATPVDWSAGHWSGYEDTMGTEGDTGGVDCTLQLFVAPAADPGAAAPPDSAQCKAALPAVAPPAPPEQPSGGGGGGGGGASLALLWLSLYEWRRRRAAACR